MSREITVVFQDCPLCGDRGRVLEKVVAEEGVRLHKVSFATNEGRELIHAAVFEKGIKHLPFYVCGDQFSENIHDLLGPEEPKSAKKAKKDKGLGDGAVLETK